MRNSRTLSFKRSEISILLGLASLAFLWSWSWECYDMRWRMGRILITVVTMAASLGLMSAGLTFAGISKPGKITAAFLAILPWNSLLLSQIPYIGYLLIPVEAAISILLLWLVLRLTIGKAFILAVLTRSAAFGVTISATEILRRWIIR
jgi:hypothetical protein